MEAAYPVDGPGCFDDEEEGHNSSEDLFAEQRKVGHEVRALGNGKDYENDHQQERNAGTPLQVVNFKALGCLDGMWIVCRNM